MSTLEEDKKAIITNSIEQIKSKKKILKINKANIIKIVTLSLIIIFIISLIIIYLYFYHFNNKFGNICFIEEKIFALNIDNDGNFTQPISEGFGFSKKNRTNIENCSYTLFKYNTSKFQIEFSKKVNSTDKVIDTLNNNNIDSNVMYVLASFIVPKFKITNSNEAQIKVNESYQNMLREFDKNNNGDKKEKFNKIFEQIGFYVPNDIIYGGRIDLTFEIDKKYHIENIEILKNEIFNSTYISYTKSSNIIKFLNAM